MANYDENAGGYRSTDNSLHYSEHDADKHSSTINSGGYGDNGGSNDVNRQVGSAAGSILGPLIVFAIVGYLFWMALRQYAFYVVPCIVLLLALRMGARRKKLAIVAGICVLAALYGALIHYPYTIEPSPFTGDYVAKASTMHTWRGFGGSTELAVGERVKVNGISRDRKFLNITTSSDKTGWVAASAFPADAVCPADEMWKIIKSNINPFGDHLMLHRDLVSDNDESFRDRDWMSVRRKVMTDYMGSTFTEGTLPSGDTVVSVTSPTGLTPKALSMATGVNRTVSGVWRKSKGEVSDMDITVLNVVYAPEATLIQLDGENSDAMRYDMGVDRSAALTDLETGNVYPLLTAEGGGGQVVLIFPPVKSHHFVLSQMNSEMKEKHKTTAGVFWDFPEVKVGNLPVQKTVAVTKIEQENAAFKPYKVEVVKRFHLGSPDFVPEKGKWLDPGETFTITGIASDDIEVIYAVAYKGGKFVIGESQMGNVKKL